MTSFRIEVLCSECKKRLPLCRSCHNVMAPEYGYMESVAKQVGKYSICGSCDAKLRQEGFLRISDSQTLLSSGIVKTNKVVEEDRV